MSGNDPANSLIDTFEIEAEVDDLLTNDHYDPDLPHAAVFDEILEALSPINFRDEAHLTASEKVPQKVLIVTVVQYVLTTAMQLCVGLCRHAGFVYIYNGAFWKVIDNAEMERFLGRAAARLGVDEITAKYHVFRANLMKQFLAVSYLAPPVISTDTVLINFSSGTYEITPALRRLRAFNPSDFIRYQLPFPYDENADCPKWIAFLKRVLPDESCQRVLAEYFGYIFTNLKLEKALVLFGTGANGKSVVFDVLAALLGPENISHFSSHSLGHEYHRASLVNKLLNYASEMSSNLESEVFKKLASGEPVEARLPYGRPFIMDRYAKLAINCNELPRDVEHTEAYFRRFLIIPFEVCIPEEERNPNLAKEIIFDELPGIFNWVLQGLDRLQAQTGFSRCDAAINALNTYRKESDSVALFVEEFGYQKVSCKEDATLLAVIFGDYRGFCGNNGFRAVSSMKLRKRLEALGFECTKINSGQLVYAARMKNVL